MNAGLEVSVGVMFVNKLDFLVSASNRLKFTTIVYTTNILEKELAGSFNKIIDVYEKWSFSIHTIHMYPEFNFLEKLVVGTDLNTTASRDHVPEIES